MSEIDFKKINRVHFIGIGGIGVSAVAKMMKGRGKKVSGSDRDTSTITDSLVDMGINVFVGHNSDNLKEDVDLVIYSPAILEDNPERMKAFDLGIVQISYPQSLGLLSKSHKTVAVSGTHGKTTTTAMISKVLVDANLNPTVIVGSILKEQKSNFIEGSSKKDSIFLVEACEYKRSFLNLYPYILVITNIDLDHLDYYKDLADIQMAFKDLSSRIPEDGYLVCDTENDNLKPILENIKCNVLDYKKEGVGSLSLKFPGNHNISNARCALSVASILGIDNDKAIESLNNFSGTWRRFDYKGETTSGALVYDDYAHAPEEVRSTLLAIKEKFPNKKIKLVFQPHLYSRTKLLFADFLKALSLADELVVLPIYAAREKEDQTINSEMLVRELCLKDKDAYYVNNFDEVKSFLDGRLNKEDILLTMGAGDVYKIGESII